MICDATRHTGSNSELSGEHAAAHDLLVLRGGGCLTLAKYDALISKNDAVSMESLARAAISTWLSEIPK